MKNLTMALAAGALTLLAANTATAQHQVYLGLLGNGGSLGYIAPPLSNDWVLGIDVAAEGTHNTRQNGINIKTQSASFNALYGANSQESNIQWFALTGVRSADTDCDLRDIGNGTLQNVCSGGSDINFGFVALYSLPAMNVGLRVTGKSGQLIAGLSF